MPSIPQKPLKPKLASRISRKYKLGSVPLMRKDDEPRYMKVAALYSYLAHSNNHMF
jgi:hypothetical protein